MDKVRLVRLFSGIYEECTVLSEETLARYAELEMAGQEPGKELPEASLHLADAPIAPEDMLISCNAAGRSAR